MSDTVNPLHVIVQLQLYVAAQKQLLAAYRTGNHSAADRALTRMERAEDRLKQLGVEV